MPESDAHAGFEGSEKGKVRSGRGRTLQRGVLALEKPGKQGGLQEMGRCGLQGLTTSQPAGTGPGLDLWVTLTAGGLSSSGRLHRCGEVLDLGQGGTGSQ